MPSTSHNHYRLRVLPSCVGFSLLFCAVAAACADNGGAAVVGVDVGSTGGTETASTGRTQTVGTGGTQTVSTGGAQTLGAEGKDTVSTGGAVTLGTGGAQTLGTGGAQTLGTGGAQTAGSGSTENASTGGAQTSGTGGAQTSGTGGTQTASTGGTQTVSTGGAEAVGTGGAEAVGTGGTQTASTGGTQTVSTGGTQTVSTGGAEAVSTGGAEAVGTGGAANDPDALSAENVARVSGYIDSLPWGQSTIDSAGLRDELIDAIIRTCLEFAPPGDGWQNWCEAFLVAAACKESSLNVEALSEDAYGGSTDPVVGLLQNRFSSTIQSYDSLGPMDSMERIGCEWPDFSGVSDWRAEGAPTWVDWMQDVHCNIAVGAWFYFVHAAADAMDIRRYCEGEAASTGILVVGMLSHLQGGNNVDVPAAHADPYANGYVAEIKEWFDNMIQPTPDPHPFVRELTTPSLDQYCR